MKPWPIVLNLHKSSSRAEVFLSILLAQCAGGKNKSYSVKFRGSSTFKPSQVLDLNISEMMKPWPITVKLTQTIKLG